MQLQRTFEFITPLVRPALAGQAQPAIEARSVSKIFKLYRNKVERVADALGFGTMAYGRSPPPQFPAVTDISFTIGRGEKVGIIGRNGAGKSTLLKLISGLLLPTGGSIDVAGTVQVLMYVGLGFHPEFTGRENIRASILYNGLTPEARRKAEADIIEFSELNEFLDQPLRTYSLGMRSRLQFACATAVMPDILIIDEVLAVGDSYFLTKSAERIRRLTSNGCTVLLVSHSMLQIKEYCNRVLWLDKGRLQMDDEPETTIAAYEAFMATAGAG